MNSKRMYFVMLGLIVLLFLGIFAGAYGANTLFEARAKKLNDMKALSSSLTTQQQGLAGAKKQVAAYSDLEKIAKTIVPQDKDQAAAVREISNLAAESGISQLSSVTFPISTLGGSAAAANSSATTTTPSSPTTTPASSASKNALTQLVPVPGVPGVYQLQITITQSSESRVSYTQFADFLSRLEQNRRTAQVTSVSLQPDPKDPSKVAFTLILNEFIKPS